MTAHPGLLHGKQSKPLAAWTSACLYLQAQPENHTPGARKAAASNHPCREPSKKSLLDTKCDKILLSQLTSFQKCSLKATHTAAQRVLSLRTWAPGVCFESQDVTRRKIRQIPQSNKNVTKITYQQKAYFCRPSGKPLVNNMQEHIFLYFDMERSVVPPIKDFKRLSPSPFETALKLYVSMNSQFE